MLFKGYKVAVVQPTSKLNVNSDRVVGYGKGYRWSDDPVRIDTACYIDVKAGDFVAIVSSSNEVMTARVVDVITDTTVNGLNIQGEVLDVIDTNAHAERERKAIEAEKLKKQMDAEVERMKEEAAYDAFAEKNPALAEMLNSYKEIIGDTVGTENK